MTLATDDLARLHALEQELARLKRGNRSEAPHHTLTTDEITALSWCPDPVCPNNLTQTPIRAVREVKTETCGDRNRGYVDGSLEGSLIAGMVENTWIYLRAADPAEATCGECGKLLELGEQTRPKYAPLSGHDPDALRKALMGWVHKGLEPPEQGQFPPEMLPQGSETEDELRATVKRLEEMVAKLAAGQAEPEELPKGVRRRGERFEALVYKSESADGKQHGVGIYDALDEAVAARERALSEAE